MNSWILNQPVLRYSSPMPARPVFRDFEHRHLKVRWTWSGFTALLACLFFALYAVLLGNLLLWIWSFLVAGLFAAHVALAFIALRRLVPERKIPERITRYTPFLCSVGLRNDSRFVPMYSIKVQDVVDGEPVDKPCFFFRLPPRVSQTTFYRHAFVHRGRAAFSGMLVTSTFPLGLLTLQVFLPLPEETLVYPEKVLTPAKRHLVEQFLERDFGSSLRFFVPGDHPRFIHWPASQRTGRTLVRTESRTVQRPVWLQVDNRLVPDPRGGFTRSEDRFERTVAQAAGTAEVLLELGWEVGVISRGELVSPVSGLQNLEQIVRFLALMSFADAPFPTPPYNDLVIDIAVWAQG
ncbi:DUF58 domain-containing protein [Myxococcota bacterium]|nr:DUF58 domain-containing protein [Myxococcota bacterium]